MSTCRSAQKQHQQQPGQHEEAEPISTRPAPRSPMTSHHRAPRPGLGERLAVFRANVKLERRLRDRRRREGFRWHEQEWESRFWAVRLGITPRAILTVSLVIVASLFVLLIAARVAVRPPVPGTGSTKRQDVNPIIIQQEENIGGTAGSPTPTLPAYIVGVWVSVMNPAASGAEQVYVRVTKNTGTAANEPAPNVKVQVTSPYGVARSIMTTSPPKQGGKGGGAAPANTAITDSNGLAIFIFFYGAAPGTAVPVYASATINGHQVSSNTTFVIA